MIRENMVLYAARIKKDGGKDVDLEFEEAEEMRPYSLVKINLVGRVMFLVESLNLLAEDEGLDEADEIVIRVLLKDEGITVTREGNGIPKNGLPPAAEKILHFVLEVLDRRLANFCELVGNMIQIQENC